MIHDTNASSVPTLKAHHAACCDAGCNAVLPLVLVVVAAVAVLVALWEEPLPGAPPVPTTVPEGMLE